MKFVLLCLTVLLPVNALALDKAEIKQNAVAKKRYGHVLEKRKRIVLNEHTKRQINDYSRRLRLSWGQEGVCYIFTGSTGTGKTMAANLLGREMSLDVFKVDLAAVISKYIGETEKNLNALFAEAEQRKLILFFDEADALFGKRTGVKDAHDRYANIEISYLVNKLEKHRGVVILASNERKNIDSAFQNTCRHVVRVRR